MGFVRPLPEIAFRKPRDVVLDLFCVLYVHKVGNIQGRGMAPVPARCLFMTVLAPP